MGLEGLVLAATDVVAVVHKLLAKADQIVHVILLDTEFLAQGSALPAREHFPPEGEDGLAQSQNLRGLGFGGVLRPSIGGNRLEEGFHVFLVNLEITLRDAVLRAGFLVDHATIALLMRRQKDGTHGVDVIDFLVLH